jgi:hypothetical protein
MISEAHDAFDTKYDFLLPVCCSSVTAGVIDVLLFSGRRDESGSNAELAGTMSRVP